MTGFDRDLNRRQLAALDGQQVVDYAAVFREKYGHVRIEMSETDTGDWHFLVFCENNWLFQGPLLLDVLNAAARFEVPFLVPREPASGHSVEVKRNERAGMWEVHKNGTAFFYGAKSETAFDVALAEILRSDSQRVAWLEEWQDAIGPRGEEYGTRWVWDTDCRRFIVDGGELVREFPLRGADWGRS